MIVLTGISELNLDELNQVSWQVGVWAVSGLMFFMVQ